jgi:DNA invertase Pin-like site-specific DNA recombinase
VLVWKLDRFGRSVTHFLQGVRELSDRGIRFVSPNQGIDSDQRSPGGKLLLQLLAAIAEFERHVITERARAGLAEARRRGKRCGRPLNPLKRLRRAQAAELRRQGKTWREIAELLNVPLSTARRAALAAK